MPLRLDPVRGRERPRVRWNLLLRSLRLFATVEDQGRVGAVSTGDDDKGNFARAGSGFSPRALASPKHPNCFAREYPEKSKNHTNCPIGIPAGQDTFELDLSNNNVSHHASHSHTDKKTCPSIRAYPRTQKTIHERLVEHWINGAITDQFFKRRTPSCRILRFSAS